MLRGKRAVITGGGGGFGQALSVWLAREVSRWILRAADRRYSKNL
jgi:NAD(P)-dependent dehydrogenase (short-subunit alcohol dehydrogenase family)